MIVRHPFRAGPEDQDKFFFEKQSLLYVRTRGPGIICFDCEGTTSGPLRHFFRSGPEDQDQIFLIFLKDSHSFMTGPEDQGSYVLIVKHYFRAGPEDQEQTF